jgi:hypothetical protein
MITKRVNKLWQGKYVSIRDYERDKAIVKGGMRLEHGKDVMELNVDQLKQLRGDGNMHQSKFGGQYELINITWQPLTHDPNQGSFI